MSPDEVLKTEGTEVACSGDSPRKTPTQERGFQRGILCPCCREGSRTNTGQPKG
jgi:hypothetical protein